MSITLKPYENERLRFGTSSFSSKDWVGPFYPDGTQASDFLSHYAEQFDTVEIDATYYAVPSLDTVKGWIDKTPDDFTISAKFPRSIVHCGKDRIPDAEKILQPDSTFKIRDQFIDTLGRLEDRLGGLLIQFPYFSKNVFPSKKEFFERLDRFLGDLPAGLRYVVEIRNKAWLTKEYVEILRSHGVGMALVDHAWMPHGDEIEKKHDYHTSDRLYIRLIGDRKEIEKITRTWEREVLFQMDSLERWADFLVRNLEKEIQTLVYINNHFAGHAPATLRRLVQMVHERIKDGENG